MPGEIPKQEESQSPTGAEQKRGPDFESDDPYKFFGIDRNSNKETVEKAYRDAIREVHADKHPGEDPAKWKAVSKRVIDNFGLFFDKEGNFRNSEDVEWSLKMKKEKEETQAKRTRNWQETLKKSGFSSPDNKESEKASKQKAKKVKPETKIGGLATLPEHEGSNSENIDYPLQLSGPKTKTEISQIESKNTREQLNQLNRDLRRLYAEKPTSLMARGRGGRIESAKNLGGRRNRELPPPPERGGGAPPERPPGPRLLENPPDGSNRPRPESTQPERSSSKEGQNEKAGFWKKTGKGLKIGGGILGNLIILAIGLAYYAAKYTYRFIKRYFEKGGKMTYSEGKDIFKEEKKKEK